MEMLSAVRQRTARPRSQRGMILNSLATKNKRLDVAYDVAVNQRLKNTELVGNNS